MRIAKNNVLIILLVILSVLKYHSYLRSCENSMNEVENIRENVIVVESQMEALRDSYSCLVLKAKRIPGFFNASALELFYLPGRHLEDQGPKEEYENARRRMYSTTKELWYYVSDQLKSALNESLSLELRQTILNEVADRKRWLLSDQEKLPALDGHVEWRRREADRVGNLVQRRLKYLQNPRDCCTANKIVCNRDNCGVGCSTHHVVYCLIVAYALKRTLVVAHVNEEEKKHLKIFHPLSETCTKVYTRRVYRATLDRHNSNVTELYLPLLRFFEGPISPQVIPKDLARRIVRFNGDPYSWWIGQLVKYILNLRRPDVINSTMADINFDLPIVGVHIRRTDKIAEAAFHDIDEYMTHVADYYAQLELTHPVAERRVYLATDEVEVLREAIAKYPQYTFYGNYSRAQRAGERSRYTELGTVGILIDVHMLSMCDHVVCTFSSNVGRLAYELMQTKRIDAVNRFTSLDDIYYLSNNEKHFRKAVMRNKDMALKIGDLIQYKKVNTDIMGFIFRTKARGVFPWYKTEEYFIQGPFPEYEEIPMSIDTRHRTDSTCIQVLACSGNCSKVSPK